MDVNESRLGSMVFYLSLSALGSLSARAWPCSWEWVGGLDAPWQLIPAFGERNAWEIRELAGMKRRKWEWAHHQRKKKKKKRRESRERTPFSCAARSALFRSWSGFPYYNLSGTTYSFFHLFSLHLWLQLSELHTIRGCASSSLVLVCAVWLRSIWMWESVYVVWWFR